MALCHCTGGKHSQLPPLLWNRSMGKMCSSVRLIVRCKTEASWSDQLHESSQAESCHSCRKCHRAVTELFSWQSFMACGQAGLSWATLSAALGSSCGTGSRKDLHFRVRQTSHFCPVVKMMVRPKEGAEQLVEDRSFAKQCKNPALCCHSTHCVLV